MLVWSPWSLYFWIIIILNIKYLNSLRNKVFFIHYFNNSAKTFFIVSFNYSETAFEIIKSVFPSILRFGRYLWKIIFPIKCPFQKTKYYSTEPSKKQNGSTDKTPPWEDFCQTINDYFSRFNTDIRFGVYARIALSNPHGKTWSTFSATPSSASH